MLRFRQPTTRPAATTCGRGTTPYSSATGLAPLAFFESLVTAYLAVYCGACLGLVGNRTLYGPVCRVPERAIPDTR